MAEPHDSLDIPTHWEHVALKDVCIKITDGTHKTPKYKPEGVRFISIKNIRPYIPINWDSYEKYISQEEHEELIKRCHPEFDDILFPRIGTLGFAKRIDFHETVSIFVGLGLLKPDKEKVRPKYLEYWMNHPLIVKLSRERSAGAGRLTLALAESRELPFPLAPLDEQDSIVAEIEKQFSRLDEAVASLKRVKANLKRYKAAVLKAAVEGKLTEEWRKQNPDVEPASKLLERILAERRAKWEESELAKMKAKGKEAKDDKWMEKHKEPERFDSVIDGAFPSGWTQSKLAMASLRIVVGYVGPVKKHLVEQGNTRFLSTTHIAENAFKNKEIRFVSDAFDEANTKSSVLPGDILIARHGDSGKACMVPPFIKRAQVSNAVIVRPSRVHTNPEFLMYAINATRQKLQDSKVGGVQQVVNTQSMSEFPLPIPPKEEQDQIAARVSEMISVFEVLNKEIDEGSRRASRLQSSILGAAFSGAINGEIEDAA